MRKRKSRKTIPPMWEQPKINKNMTAKEILQEVARCHGVTVEQIKSKRKFRTIAFAKFHACYLIKEHKNFSQTQIAKIVNLDDHTSVHWAIKIWPEREKLNAKPKSWKRPRPEPVLVQASEGEGKAGNDSGKSNKRALASKSHTEDTKGSEAAKGRANRIQYPFKRVKYAGYSRGLPEWG